MAFGSMGTGFLDTDPRNKKRPTGGSSKAGQSKDTSVLNTGNPADGGVGYGSAAFSLFNAPTIRPPVDPTLMQRTASEAVEYRESKGVATTHKNMGSLAVDFRASEKAKTEAGEETVQGKRDAKVLDAREASEYQRLIGDPAKAEATRFRAQAARSKSMFDTYKHSSSLGKANYSTPKKGGTTLSSSKKGLTGGSRSSSGILDSNKRKPGGTGPDHSWLLPEVSKEFQQNKDNPDLMALAATREHSAAPGTQAVDWKDQANAQSATGKATPSQMAQAAVSMHARKTPNK